MSQNLNKEKCLIPNDVTWQEITPGGVVTSAGNAHYFKTGDWRAEKPIFLADKCKHCMLCFPVCPDSSIPVENKKRLDFDYDHCKGCGVCAVVCPFNAIDMVSE